jgi:hypothetical protein
MAVSDQLSRLSTRAKQAEDRVAATKTQARDRIAQDVENARLETQAAAEKLRSESAAATDRADAWADNLQRSWNEHVAQARERMDARKARYDAKVAERDAKDAEDYAAFAYSAIEEAEYAVLDAVLYRFDADAAAASAPSS